MYPFSDRLSSSLTPTPFAQSLAHARQSGTHLLDLTISNPTVAFDNYPHREIQHSFAQIASLTYAPEPLGTLEARTVIAQYYSARGLHVDPERIVLTASTSEAYSLLFKLLCNPGDEVLIPSPSYPLFEHLARFDSVLTRNYQLRYDGTWHIDFADLASQIRPTTKAMVVVSPNNPTGSCLTEDERNRLTQISVEHGIALLCDEVFADYIFGPRKSVIRSMSETAEALCFSLNGLSKIGGMPQLKLAWIVISGPENDRWAARDRLEVLSDTYLSVSTPVQKALPALLGIAESFQSEIRQRVSDNVERIDNALRFSPAHRLNLDGGWSTVLKLPATHSEDEWINGLLADHHVIVQPGYFFDLTGGTHLVLSLLTPPADLEAGLTSFGKMLADWS